MAVDALFYYDSSLIDADNKLTVGPLNADEDEVSGWFDITVKLDTGYESNSDLVVGPDGTSAAKWQMAEWTSGDTTAPQATPEDYGADLTIGGEAGEIDDSTGVVFWVRAKATSGESAANDTSVSFAVVSGTAVASA